MKKFVTAVLALAMLLSLTACNGLSFKPGGGSSSDDKEGYIGDTLSTYWFDFTVDDAYSCSEYSGYTAGSGKQLVVVSMTLKNTWGQSVDMWDSDFPLLWGGEDDGDLDYPIAPVSDEQFPQEYSLGINQSKSGVLVYEAPADYRDFSLAFLEVFEDEDNEEGRDGDLYFVDFTAEKR
ncbi:MAG: DUF4352 domain-containing protein [Oscillospiraceae bacterium]